MLTALLVLICIAVLLASFTCSIAEAVLLSLNPLALRARSNGKDDPATRWLALKNQIERPIAAILVFNTVANTGLATLAGALFIKQFGPETLWIFSIFMTLAILFGGEMAPKILGVHHAQRIAPHLLRPLEWMLRVAHPFVWLMDRFCERLKSSGADRQSSDHIMDIITLVQAAKAEQAIHNREEIIIIHAATLSARRVRTIMVPAPAVRIFDARKSLQQNIRDAGTEIHRSYPVSRNGTLNDILGVIRVREAVVNHMLADDPSTETAWHHWIRPAISIGENASLTQLLATFLENDEIAALVSSSKSPGNVGWITLDDVTETLMGARG